MHIYNAMQSKPTFVPPVPLTRSNPQPIPCPSSSGSRRSRSRSRTPAQLIPQSSTTLTRMDEAAPSPDWLRTRDTSIRPPRDSLRTGIASRDALRVHFKNPDSSASIASSPSSTSPLHFLSMSPLVAPHAKWACGSPPSYCNVGTHTLDDVSNLNSRVSYLGPVSRHKVNKAVELARSTNVSESVLSENMNVALIVADLRMDCDTICAALLRTLVHKPGCSPADVETVVGTDVLNILTYHEQLEDSVRLCVDKTFTELSFANLRQLILVRAASEHRAISLELARAVLAIRTVDALPDEESRYSLARRTMFLYAPLANQFGMWFLQGELEELAFLYLEPESFEMIRLLVGEQRRQCEDMLDASREYLERLISKDPEVRSLIRTVRVKGRVKGLYSVYRKLRRSGKKMSEIFDLLALRVIVQPKKADEGAEEAACYAVANLIQQHYQTMESRYKDYIASPKPNGYRSLHLTVLHHGASAPFEIQIRSEKMHHVAEFGAAAHWIYKENSFERESNECDKPDYHDRVDIGSDDDFGDLWQTKPHKPTPLSKTVTCNDKTRHAVIQTTTKCWEERCLSVSPSTVCVYPESRAPLMTSSMLEFEGECRVAQEKMLTLEQRRQALRPGGNEHNDLLLEMRSGYVSCLASAIRTSRVIVTVAGQMYGLAIGTTLQDLAHGLGIATLRAIVNGSVAPLTQQLEMNDIIQFIQP